MKTFAIGDIHGYLKPLEQCLNRSGFDFENDRLICLGDVADRGPETFECFELLLTIKNLVYILGNHDCWLLKYFNDKSKSLISDWAASWLKFGGKATLLSYQKNEMKFKRHQQLLNNANLFYLDESDRLYMHGGFETDQFLIEQTAEIFCWNRSMWEAAYFAEDDISYQLDTNSSIKSNTIFIGHTCTHRKHPNLKPKNFKNVWNLDQGAGHGYKLTIMEVEKLSYWQSDLVKELYKFQ